MEYPWEEGAHLNLGSFTLRDSSNTNADQNVWFGDPVVRGVGDGWSDFRWALPCEHTSIHPFIR